MLMTKSSPGKEKATETVAECKHFETLLVKRLMDQCLCGLELPPGWASCCIMPLR
jgi:hypothetical protein